MISFHYNKYIETTESAILQWTSFFCTEEVSIWKKNKTTIPAPEKQEYAVVKSDQTHPLSETWAQDALQDLDDFIESQGIYIRQ